MTENFKSGFIAIVGRPNVGKSTFMNQIIGEKIAIMSDKAQTTRNRIQGVLTTDDAQLVFIDTPGIHKPKHRLGNFMVETAENTLNEVDAVLFMVNAAEGYGKGDQYILDRLQQITNPVFLLINKTDLVQSDQLLPLIDQYRTQYPFAEIIPISARLGDNLPRLYDELKKRIPQGPRYYPDDHVTDHPEQFVISEFIREKVLELTKEEIPHSIAVAIENIAERQVNTVFIQAAIVTERESQKGIVIGRQGTMLKAIGQHAREDIETLLGSKVYLDLWVKVKKNWRNNASQLHEFGFRHDEY